MFIVKVFTEQNCYQKSKELEDLDYDPVINLLRQLRINCLLYQDSEGKLAYEIGKCILKWSDEKQTVRKKAELLYAHLFKNNRFLKISELTYLDVSDLNKVLKILKDKEIEAVVTGKLCQLPEKFPFIEFVDIKKISQSRIIKRIEECQEIEIKNEFKERNLFKTNVLKEIIENTKNEITIYDRHIGAAGLRKDDRGELLLSTNYKETLNLLYEAFLEFTDKSRERKFVLITGIKHDRYSANDMKYVFEELIEPFKNEINFKYEIYVKKEKQGKELKHARYLFSSIFDYKFEHGFGFLETNDSENVHNLEISVIPKEKVTAIKKDLDELNLEEIVKIAN